MSDRVSNRPIVSVVVPSYRRPERCERLLRSLSNQSLDPSLFEVLAVDNGSNDGTGNLLERLVDEVPYRLRPLRVMVNRGPARARNLGWKEATAPIVAFTDDDCVPEANWLEAGLNVIALDVRLGVVQGRTRPAESDEPTADGPPEAPWTHSQSINGPTPHFEACNVFYRREAIAAGGGFSEEIGWWGEDAAAGWRVLENGWDRAFAPSAVVRHDVEVRGVRWNLRNGFLEHNMVRLAGEHPGFRDEGFWRPWAFRPADAAFVVAIAGLLVSLRWRPAVLAALPYLRLRAPRSVRADALRLTAEAVAVDAARSVGQIYGAVRARVLVI